MKISMWTHFLHGLTLEQMAQTFAKHGFECAELSSEHACDLLDRGDPQKTGKAYRQYCSELGLSFPQGHLYLQADIAHPDEPERARTMEILKRSCDLFCALGIEAGVLHAGGGGMRRAGCERDKILQQQVAGLEQVLSFVRGTSLTICLENGSNELEGLLSLIAVVGEEQTGICLDTGHLNLVKGNCAEFVGRAGNKLRALHIADNRGEKDDHMFPYAKGATVNWDGFIEALRGVGYSGIFNFEVSGESIGVPLAVRLAKLDYARGLAEAMIGPSGGV